VILSNRYVITAEHCLEYPISKMSECGIEDEYIDEEYVLTNKLCQGKFGIFPLSLTFSFLSPSKWSKCKKD